MLNVTSLGKRRLKGFNRNTKQHYVKYMKLINIAKET